MQMLSLFGGRNSSGDQYLCPDKLSVLWDQYGVSDRRWASYCQRLAKRGQRYIACPTLNENGNYRVRGRRQSLKQGFAL